MRRWSTSSSIRTSVTARSSSVADNFHLRVLDDAGHGYDLVAANDERPRLALRARHLRVDEHVLDLAPPTCQPVAGPPSAHSKPLELRADPPLAPADLAGQLDRAVLEPQPLVLTYRLESPAEVDALRPDRRREQLGQRRRQCGARVERAQEVLVRRGMEPAQQRQDLVADQAALRVRVRGVDAELEPNIAAVRLRFLTPQRKERVDDAVLAPRGDPGRRTAGDEPVEDRLHLIRSGVAGCPQPIGSDGTPLLAERGFREPVAVELHDLSAEDGCAEARVPVGVGSAELVVDVERRDAIAERAEHVPEAGRVG